MERGQIVNRKRSQQIIDFSGVRYGNITPTDIDGFIDFGNKFFVVIELKLVGNDLPYGQRLAIERIVDNLVLSGKKCIAIVANHEVVDCDKDINCSECIVKEIRLGNKWHTLENPKSVKKIIDYFLKEYKI